MIDELGNTLHVKVENHLEQGIYDGRGVSNHGGFEHMDLGPRQVRVPGHVVFLSALLVGTVGVIGTLFVQQILLRM